MALPTWVNAGSIATGAGALTTIPPTGLAVDDICYLGIESFGTDGVPTFTNEQPASFDDWVQVATQVQGGTRLTIFRAKVIAVPVSSPTLGDVGDHLATRMVAVRGADTSDPNETITLGTDATSDTSGTMPAHTTGGADRLVLLFATADLPDATGTAEYSWTSFGNLANGAERTDNSVTSGNGGSLSWATGELAAAGSIGTITYTKANAGVKAHAVIAVKPPAAGTPHSVSPADTLGLTDARTVSHGHGRVQADTLGLTDARTFVQGHKRTAGDTLGLGDATTVAVAYARTIADTLGLTDSASPVAGGGTPHTRSVADGFALTDARTVAAARFRTVADGLALTDARTLAKGLSRTVADGLALTDSQARVVAYRRTVPDALGLTDAVILPGAGGALPVRMGENDRLGADAVGSLRHDATVTASGKTSADA